MNIYQIVILAVAQGLAELLPVSSSAHVILLQRAMGLDPSAPEMTFLLVMLHTGTMFAVLLYFGKRWARMFHDVNLRMNFFKSLALATIATAVLGLALKFFIERIILERLLGRTIGEVEALFSVLPLVAVSLFAAGILIVIAGTRSKGDRSNVSTKSALLIGLAQGLCLPFRGLSRSGATISVALLQGVARASAEDFSFALAVILTPPVILLELRRLLRAPPNSHADLISLLAPGLAGMLFSFLAGLVALRWLSSWLENGRWAYFGIYCFIFGAVVLAIQYLGVL